MAGRRSAAAPRGLSPAGRALWRRVQASLDERVELDELSLAILERACGCADVIAKLEQSVRREGVTVKGPRGTVVHPAIAEIRQQKLALLRLVRSLEVDRLRPASAAATSKASRYAKRAAEARWGAEGEGEEENVLAAPVPRSKARARLRAV